MSLPKWNDPSLRAGTMVRTALWLASEVGVGNLFTKEAHRAAFAGVAQADRRLRDLRKFGWVFHTSKEDITLRSHEQRFVVMGAPVWQPGHRSSERSEKLSNKARREILSDFAYQCATCGIAAGEIYADAPLISAVLSMSRVQVRSPEGIIQQRYIPECARCRAGASNAILDLRLVLGRIERLAPFQRTQLRNWIVSGRPDDVDSIWQSLRPLAAQERALVLHALTTLDAQKV